MTFDHARRDALAAAFVVADLSRAQLILEADGRIASWNRGAVRLFGLSEAQALGRPIDDFFPAAERSEDRSGRMRARAALGEAVGEEAWLVRGDGSEFLAHLMMIGVGGAEADDAPPHDAFGLAIEDITAGRASEVALTRNELHLRSILATVPDAMIVIDEQGHIQSFSAAAERLFGFAEAELIGRNVNVLMPDGDSQRHDDYIAHYRRTGERRIIGKGRIVMGRKRDGTEFPIELSVGETVSDGHRLFTGFIRDLTERQRAELQLKELQSELIHISRVSAMGTMASTLAHELNQPLTAIANYMEAGQGLIEGEGETADMLREAMRESASEALRAGAIVRRLREFVSRGEVEKKVERLETLVEEAGRLALIGARERGVRAFFDLDPAAPLVLVDRIQVQQVLVNLIRNAVEALDGCVERDIRVSSEAAGEDFVRISVADSGKGIDSAIRPRLFEAFNSSKDNGMGLGLSICRTIVEAHGGRISAIDRPGGGTIIQFTLPSGTTQAGAEAA